MKINFRSIKAIFKKQMKDLLKNRETLIIFFIFPLVAWMMTEFVAKPQNLPTNIFVAQFIAMFSCMVLITTTSTIIAEEKEKKSLKFLMMAGVREHEYILGLGGALALASFVVSLVFAAIAGFSGRELLVYLSFFMLNIVGSILIGAACGLLSRNVQASTGISTPVAMILGFLPMFAGFNDQIRDWTRWIYSVRFAEMTIDFNVAIMQPLIVTLINLLVLAIVFAVIYRTRGLARG